MGYYVLKAGKHRHISTIDGGVTTSENRDEVFLEFVQISPKNPKEKGFRWPKIAIAAGIRPCGAE
jgi:hypothetical protein